MAVLDARTLETQLRRRHGNMAACARHFGVTRGAVWKFVQTRPTLQAVVSDCREAMKDYVEKALYRAARKGEGWAVCFFLKCQARDRGYTEPREHTPLDELLANLPPGFAEQLRGVLSAGLLENGNRRNGHP